MKSLTDAYSKAVPLPLVLSFEVGAALFPEAVARAAPVVPHTTDDTQRLHLGTAQLWTPQCSMDKKAKAGATRRHPLASELYILYSTFGVIHTGVVGHGHVA